MWAKGWSSCLTGLPAGSYSIDLMNATLDGVGECVGSSSVYLYGASSLNPIDDNGFFVAQQYRDFYNREPDQAGLDFWTSQITQCTNQSYREPGETYGLCIVRKRAEVSSAFWYSVEFLQLHPGLRNPPGTVLDFNNSEFAWLCNTLYLRRDPTQAESDFWVAQLDATGDYSYAIKAYINSDEYRVRFEPPPPPPPCDPPTSQELDLCRDLQGWWDYSSCQCNYGPQY